MTVLLKECRDIQLRCGSFDRDYDDDNTMSMIAVVEMNSESDAEKVISERLVSYKFYHKYKFFLAYIKLHSMRNEWCIIFLITKCILYGEVFYFEKLLQLTFKDINGLVEQNVQLRSLVRSLSDQIENRDSELKVTFTLVYISLTRWICLFGVSTICYSCMQNDSILNFFNNGISGEVRNGNKKTY